jgi:phosphoribosylcarboxyaminoimidazole (NCAIR) mutase
LPDAIRSDSAIAAAHNKERQMRSLVRFVLAASGIVLLIGVQAAEAQVTGPVEFATTFPFAVGNTTVPAGSYTIRPDNDNPQILELTGPHTAVFFEVTILPAARTPDKTEVVFKRYGQSYVLKDVWIAGSGGAETLTVEAERHHASAGTSTTEHHVPAKIARLVKRG